MRKYIKEDAIDDIGRSVQNLRIQGQDPSSKLTVSKNLLKGPSKDIAQRYAKSFKAQKWLGDDWTKKVRKTFTDVLSFKDRTLYRDLTVEMRKILVVDNSDPDSQSFEVKDELRKGYTEIGEDYRYYDIDKIATAELTTIFILKMFYTDEDLKDLDDQVKYDTAVFCTKEVIDRIENSEDVSDELLAGDIVKDYAKEYQLEPIGNETTILSEEPFTKVATIDIDAEVEKDLAFTKDEIKKDNADRKAAKEKHAERERSREEDARKIKDDLKELHTERYNKLIKSKLVKLGFEPDDYDLLLDKYYSMHLKDYAMAGYDYFNVDHVAEETAADEADSQGQQKYGDRWTDRDYLSQIQDAVRDMPKIGEWFEKYSNLLGANRYDVDLHTYNVKDSRFY